MKYLIIASDYTGSCIRDEFEGEIKLEDLEIPFELMQEISIWNSAYQKIIPLNEVERKKQVNVINSLDSQGLSIANRLTHLIPGGAKIKYFSEGQLKYMQ